MPVSVCGTGKMQRLKHLERLLCVRLEMKKLRMIVTVEDARDQDSWKSRHWRRLNLNNREKLMLNDFDV